MSPAANATIFGAVVVVAVALVAAALLGFAYGYSQGERDARRAREILTAIIYASDGCVGHKDCNHSVKPWKEAREFLGLLREGEKVPPD